MACFQGSDSPDFAKSVSFLTGDIIKQAVIVVTGHNPMD